MYFDDFAVCAAKIFNIHGELYPISALYILFHLVFGIETGFLIIKTQGRTVFRLPIGVSYLKTTNLFI